MKKSLNKEYLRWGIGAAVLFAVIAVGYLVIAKLVEAGIIGETPIGALTAAILAIAAFASSKILCKGDIKTTLIYAGILCAVKVCIFMTAGDINYVGVYDIAEICAAGIGAAAGGIKFTQKKKSKKRAKYTKK